MGEVTPRQFLCEWKSRGGCLQDDDGLSSEDAALARWRGADRVATRKLRVEESDRPDTTSVCYTIDPSSAASAFRRRPTESSTMAANEDVTAAIRDGDSRFERVNGLTKRQRPQSACSAAARQWQLERSHAATELEARVTPSRPGRVRQRPQSARSRSSTTTPPGLGFARGELANKLEASKWTDMLHRSPSFRQSSLQKLEAETYALLRFALGKTRTRSATKATDGTNQSCRRRNAQQRGPPDAAKRGAARLSRPSSAKQRNKLGSSEEPGVFPTSGIACGSGVQVARSKKQQCQCRTASDLYDGPAQENHRRSPHSELQTEVAKVEGAPDHGSRNESSASDDDRHVLREKTRLRGNDMKRRAISKRAPATPKDLHGGANDGAQDLGRRTAAWPHWIARASLALPASARRSGGDPDRSPRIDEYVLAVAETVLRRATADQQPTKTKKSSATPRATKNKRQTANTPVPASRLFQQASKPGRDAEGLIGGVRANVVKAKVWTSALDEAQERCETAIAPQQTSRVEGTDALVQSREVRDGANATAAEIPSTAGGEIASAWKDEPREDVAASAPVSAEFPYAPRDLSPALATPRLEEENATTDPLPPSQEDRGQRGELVSDISASIDGGHGDFTSLPSAAVDEARASEAPASDSEESGGRLSETVDGRNAVLPSAVCESDAAVAVYPASPAITSELGDAKQDEESNTIASLQQTGDCGGKPDVGTGDQHEPVSSSSSPRTDPEIRFHPDNSCDNTARSHLAEQDHLPDLAVAPLSADAEDASNNALLQDVSIESSTGEAMVVPKATTELAAEPEGVIESTVFDEDSDEERCVDLLQKRNAAVVLEGDDESSGQLDVSVVDPPDDHEVNGDILASSSGEASEDPNEAAGASESTNARPKHEGDLDHTRLTSAEEAGYLVPMLVITMASDVNALDDTAGRTVGRNIAGYSNDWELSESEAGAFESPNINEGGGNDALPAITDVLRNTSRDNAKDCSNYPHADVSADGTSSRPLDSNCVQPADANADYIDDRGDSVPILAGEQVECESGPTEGMGEDERAEEMRPSIASEIDVFLLTDKVTKSEEHLGARAEVDSVQMTPTNGPMSSTESNECADSSPSSLPDTSAIASEAVRGETSEGHALERLLEDDSRDNGDELMPDEITPDIEVRQDSASSASVVTPRCDEEPHSNVNEDINSQLLGNCNEHAPVTPENAAATLESSDLQDTNSTVLSEEGACSTSVLDGVVSTDTMVPSALSAEDCDIGAPDEVQDVSHEYPSQAATSNENVPCQAVDRSPLTEPVMPMSVEPQVIVEAAESTPPFVDKPASFLGGGLALSLTTEEQQPVIGDTNTSSELSLPDESTSLPIACARRIQRQYRCFICRRLLLDQLQFYLNHHRRQARKRAKRESLRASVVIVASDNSDAEVNKEELAVHVESGAPATIAPAAAEKADSSGDTASPSSASENVGAKPNASEELQATRDDEGENACVQAASEPQLYVCLFRDRQGIASDLAEAESCQRDGGGTHNHSELNSISTEAGEEVQGGHAILSAADGCASVERQAGAMNAPTRPDVPFGPHGLPYDGDRDDPIETRSTCDGQRSGFQPDHFAIAHTDVDAAAVEHSAPSEPPYPEDADGDVENGRSDREQEMKVATQHNNPDDTTPDDNAVHEEQDDHAEQWKRCMDAASNKFFYYNRTTGESRWTAPTEGCTVNTTAVDYELISTPSLVPDELDQDSERTSSAINDPDALTSQAHWELRRHGSQFGEQRGGWQAFVDEATQATFYYNKVTGESTWVPPREFGVGASSYLSDEIDSGAASSLHDDQWVTCIDPANGMPYYANLVTNETSWKKSCRAGEGNSGASVVPAAIDLCELALEGDGEAIDRSLIGDGDTQTTWTTGAVDVAHYGQSVDVETPYEEDYVIDFDDETRD